MSSGGEKKKLGMQRLQQVIELCKSVDEKSVDPFIIDVKDIIAVVKRYFSQWELPEELCLDSEALDYLASVIKSQGGWLQHQSTSLYKDPFLITEKLRSLSQEELVNFFLTSWRPIVELEQISLNSLREALKYWDELIPINERWRLEENLCEGIGVTSRNDLIKQKILADKAFTEKLRLFWLELKERAGGSGKMKYWDFVGANTYSDTVKRAYMVSFLATYGYAKLEIRPFEEAIFIIPNEEPNTEIGKSQLISITIPVGVDEWIRWKRGDET